MSADAQHATSPTTPSAGLPAERTGDRRVLPCSRRALLRGAGASGAALGAAGLLAACGGSGEPAPDGTASASGGSAEGSVAASQVAEGSAVVVEVGGEQVVLAQPTAGQFVAYSAACTHAGGVVQAESGTQVRCPLHGSVFDAGDGGAVLEGPATQPLEALSVAQQGDQLVIT